MTLILDLGLLLLLLPNYKNPHLILNRRKGTKGLEFTIRSSGNNFTGYIWVILGFSQFSWFLGGSRSHLEPSGWVQTRNRLKYKELCSMFYKFIKKIWRLLLIILLEGSQKKGWNSSSRRLPLSRCKLIFQLYFGSLLAVLFRGAVKIFLMNL